jgi:hypothetical protein
MFYVTDETFRGRHEPLGAGKLPAALDTLFFFLRNQTPNIIARIHDTRTFRGRLETLGARLTVAIFHPRCFFHVQATPFSLHYLPDA